MRSMISQASKSPFWRYHRLVCRRWRSNPNMSHNILKVIFAGSLLYTFPMMFTKLSILVFYLRLQPREAARPGYRASVYTLMAFVISTTIAFWFAIIFECSPIAYAWDLSLNGTCINRTMFYYFNSALHILGDFAVYFMALPLVSAVKLPKRQKRGLYVVLCLGCL